MVGDGVTLTIKEGAKVLFASRASLVVQSGGKLIVNGTELKPVEFKPQNEDKPWGQVNKNGEGRGGIEFLPGSGGKMSWCIVQQAVGINIKIQGSSPTIQYCDIRGSEKGIEVSGEAATPKISHNWIHDNVLWGLHFLDGANGTVEQNFIYCNKKKPGAAGDTANGIHIWKNSKPTITNNLIFDSKWGIEVGWASHATIEKNLFVNVTYGILYYDYDAEQKTMRDASEPKVKDNYFSVKEAMLAAQEYKPPAQGGEPSVGKFTKISLKQLDATENNTEVKEVRGRGPTFPNVTCPANDKPDFKLEQYPPANGYGPNSIQIPQPVPSKTITITVYVDEKGKVTGKTIEPADAEIRGASKWGTADGDSVAWKVAWKAESDKKAENVTVTIAFEFDEGSPFLNSHFKMSNIDIDPNGPNKLYSGCTMEVSGKFRYDVKVTQRRKPVDGGEGTIEVKPIGAPSTTKWGLIVLGLLLAGSLAWMIRRRFGTKPAGA